MRVTQDTLFQFVQQITGQTVSSLLDFNSGILFIDILRKLFPQVYKLNSEIVQNNIQLKQGPEQARQNYELIMLLLKQNNFPSNLFKQTLFELGDKQQIQDFLVMMFYIHQLQIGNTQQIAIELKVSKQVTAFLLSDQLLQIIKSTESDVDMFINELQDISISNVDELLRKSVFRSDLAKSQAPQHTFEIKQDHINGFDAGIHKQQSVANAQLMKSQLVQKSSKFNQTVKQAQDPSIMQGNTSAYSQTYQYKPPTELISTRPLTGTINSKDIRGKQKQINFSEQKIEQAENIKSNKFDDAPEVLMSLIQNPNNKSMCTTNNAKEMLQIVSQNTTVLVKNLIQNVLPQLIEFVQNGIDKSPSNQANVQIQEILQQLSQQINSQNLEEIQSTSQKLQEIYQQIQRQNGFLDQIIKYQDSKAQDLSNDQHEAMPEGMIISGTLGKSTIQQEVEQETDRFSVLIFVLLRRITQLEQLQKREGETSEVNFMQHMYSCLQQQFKSLGSNKNLLSYQQIQQKLAEFDESLNNLFNQKIIDLEQAQYSDDLMSILERLRQQNDIGTLDLDLRQFFTKEELEQLSRFLKKDDWDNDLSQSRYTSSQQPTTGLGSSQITQKRGFFGLLMSKLSPAPQEEDFLSMDREQLSKFISAIKVENSLNKHYISQLIYCFEILKQQYDNIQAKNERITAQMIQMITKMQQSATAEIVKLTDNIPAAAQREAEIAYLKQVNETQLAEMQTIEQQLELQNQQLFDLQKAKRQQDALIKQQNSRQSDLIQLMLRLKQLMEESGVGVDRMADINRALSAHFGQQVVSSQPVDSNITQANEQRYRDLNTKYQELQRQSAQQAAELQQHRTQYAMLQANYQALQRFVEQIQTSVM